MNAKEELAGCRAALYPGYRRCGKSIVGERTVEIRHVTYAVPVCGRHLRSHTFEVYAPMDLERQA